MTDAVCHFRGKFKIVFDNFLPLEKSNIESCFLIFSMKANIWEFFDL